MSKNRNECNSAVQEEIRQKYDKVAPWYDLMEGVPELLGLRKLRCRLLQRASGKVLEIAVGTGKNLRCYPKTCQIIGVDFSPAMLQIARKRADRLGLNIPFLVMDAESLAFPDQSFDTVVSSLTLCTFPDPVAALREMARVCRADGRILLLEHGRSDREWLGRWQDRRADRHAKKLGCRWNRKPLDLVHQAGLMLIAAQRTFFGIFHVLEAMPPVPAPAHIVQGTAANAYLTASRMTAPSILFLDEVTDRHLVGGKARGLARLLAAGFLVPEGFVAAPDATAEEIIAAYRRLGAPRLAVRSSAEEEDSDRLSYAGQFETCLGVEGVEALGRAVEACRASASSSRSASYREDILPAAHRMFVIVQRVLEPDYAGVAFAGADGTTLIEGVAGLGDRLVSGRSGPTILPEDLRTRMERLAREAVERLGGALDIEWAAEKGRIWLLQARPITVPLPAALPERFRLWTAANFQESIPRPLTPFSEELARHNIREIFRISFDFAGLPEPDGPIERLVKGRFYMSYSAMASAMSVLPGFRMENLFRMFGDGPGLVPFVAYRQGRRLPFLLKLPATLARLAGWIFFAERRIHEAGEAARAFAESVRSAIADGAIDAELLALFRSAPTSIRPAVKAMSISAGLANGLLSAMMQLAAENAPEVPSAEVASMAAVGEMESLEPSRRLAAFADWLRENSGRPNDDPEVEARLAHFLDACGFRCENEPELAQPRWRERPKEVLRLARQMASTPSGPSASSGPSAAGTRRRAFLHRVLLLYARPARTWQQRREATRAVLVRTAESLRHLLLEIGRRLRNRKILDDPEEVFYLLRDEIELLLDASTSSPVDATIAIQVERRRERHRRMLGWSPPPRLLAELPDGRLTPFAPDPLSGETLLGFGVSPGRVTGRAHVLLDIGQAEDLQPGEVLVARTTDIGWTPLFRLASAVVTEIGAPTSHAAIVARELGLPAVVNVDRVTERVRTGDLLFVDGWAGHVRTNPAPEL